MNSLQQAEAAFLRHVASGRPVRTESYLERHWSPLRRRPPLGLPLDRRNLRPRLARVLLPIYRTRPPHPWMLLSRVCYDFGLDLVPSPLIAQLIESNLDTYEKLTSSRGGENVEAARLDLRYFLEYVIDVDPFSEHYS